MLSKREKIVTKKMKKKWKKDSIYLTFWFNKFINILMKSGKKSTIQKNINIAFILLKEKLAILPIFIYFEILDLVSPNIELIPKRLGRNWFRIPVPITGKRSKILGNSWLYKSIKFSNIKLLYLKIYKEFISIYIYKQSDSLKKKEQVYKLSIFNRTHDNYRWR